LALFPNSELLIYLHYFSDSFFEPTPPSSIPWNEALHGSPWRVTPHSCQCPSRPPHSCKNPFTPTSCKPPSLFPCPWRAGCLSFRTEFDHRPRSFFSSPIFQDSSKDSPLNIAFFFCLTSRARFEYISRVIARWHFFSLLPPHKNLTEPSDN